MKKLSLQDQLLKAGLSNETKAKQVRTEKRKQSKKQQKNKAFLVDETKVFAQESKAKQLEKDKLLNKQKNELAEKKQIVDQITQLINLNKLTTGEEGIAYNFTDQGKVKTLYISEDIKNKIIAGSLAIVKSIKTYEIVPAKVAEKIKQRNEQIIIVLFSAKVDSINDDEYQGYEIPDDLMW